MFNEISNNIHYSREIIFSTYTCRQCTKRVEDSNVKARRWGHTQFICHNVSREDDELYFDVSYIDINPPISCNRTAPVTLTMCDLSEKINNAEEWYSGPFFAFYEGYQMCLKVYTTGYNESNEHLSVFIHLMKGPHDDKLQQSGHWPLRGTFTIKLLNQFKNHHYSKNITFSKHAYVNCDECIQRVVKGDTTVGWGESKFLSHHDITDYLKEDCLNFEIFYEDTGTDLPDLSSEQIAQAYSAGDLVANIFHVIKAIVEIIVVILREVLIILVILQAVCYGLAFILGDITGIKLVIFQVVFYGLEFMLGVISGMKVVILQAVYYGLVFIQGVIIDIIVGFLRDIIPWVIIGIIMVWIFKALN